MLYVQHITAFIAAVLKIVIVHTPAAFGTRCMPCAGIVRVKVITWFTLYYGLVWAVAVRTLKYHTAWVLAR